MAAMGWRGRSVGGADFCLECDGTVDEIVVLLKKRIKPEAAPGPRSCARGRLTNIYFRDPDNKQVEFTVY